MLEQQLNEDEERRGNRIKGNLNDIQVSKINHQIEQEVLQKEEDGPLEKANSD